MGSINLLRPQIELKSEVGGFDPCFGQYVLVQLWIFVLRGLWNWHDNYTLASVSSVLWAGAEPL